MPIAKSVEDTVLGEAKAGDFADMLGIVSVIDNRATQLGVSYQDVVAAQGQFDAFGKAMPPGVGKFRDMARQAIAQVQERGPVHTATFYATPAATKGLPKGLSKVAETKGHQYFTDPQQRSIATAQGYKTPDPSASRAPDGLTNVAGDPSGTLYGVVDESVAAAPAVATRGILSDATPASSTPAFDSLLGVTTPKGDPYSLGYKSDSKRSAVASMTPAAQAAMANFSRGLKDPGAYTVTSTAEARPGLPGLTHVRDKAAFDTRTRGLSQKQLDDAVVAAMYDKSVKSIGLDTKTQAPHLHVGLTTPYGKGVLSGSKYGKLSPDVASKLGQWDAHQKGLLDEFSPMVPESIAPTPIDRAAPVGPVERGFLADVPGYAQATYAAPVGEVERSGLSAISQAAPVGPSYNIDQPGLTAPSFSGPAPRSVSATSFGPAGATPAGFTELGAIGKTGRAGVSTPSFSAPSILGDITMPTVGPTFAPAAPAPVAPAAVAPAPTAFAVPDVAPVPTPRAGILGPLSPPAPTATQARAPGITAPAMTAPTQQSRQAGPSQGRSAIGQGLRGAAGAVAGGMIGGLLGPVGGLLGSYVGAQMAKGKNPFSGLLGRSQATAPQQAMAAYARGYSPGLGFPEAPAGPASQGGLTAFGQAASRGGFGGQAQAAANNPGTGLF